jgi:hypothetical protein
MRNIRFRNQLIISLAFLLIILEAGCRNLIPSSPTSSSPIFSVTPDFQIPPSATPIQPTLAPTYLTPNPTATPLTGGGRTIAFQDYN